MPSYLSPGVYVEEIPSAVQPIAGVGTSTAGFIGLITQEEGAQDEILIPQANPSYNPGKGEGLPVEIYGLNSADLVGHSLAEDVVLSLDAGVTLNAAQAQAIKELGAPNVKVKHPVPTAQIAAGMTLAETLQAEGQTLEIVLNGGTASEQRHALEAGFTIEADHVDPTKAKLQEQQITEIMVQEEFNMGDAAQSPSVLVGKTLIEPVAATEAAYNEDDFIKTEADAEAISRILELSGRTTLSVQNQSYLQLFFSFPEPAGEVKLCTNFGEFKKSFGDFSANPEQNRLAHAVYGFFNNGGTRCYVARIQSVSEVAPVLEKFEAIDEIALVAAPGLSDAAVHSALVTHCQQHTQDRFAILDSPELLGAGDSLDATLLDPANSNNLLPDNTNYAAFYVPWLQVFDPAAKTISPSGTGRIFVPPSGHIAGIYARVDTNRGVHKAPANEVVLGALGLKYAISKSQQNGLNPHGVNCIRDLNGNRLVWGGRTLGGDANGEWKYINVRRLFLFLRESIDEGLQWAVFEPNDANLWAKITRNVTAFLTNVWRSGALFGATPQEAFYVKCDAETNPPEEREAGRVITEIGVAVTKPAEFVIFRISQWAGPGG